jgi:AcrR family transcriptional regulator
MPVRARERLLDTAEELFYTEGIRAVGIERLVEESGIGRASFYRHFPSKEELVVAVLRQRDAAWREWLESAVETRQLDPESRPLAVFDALAERFRRRDFRGCAFINTIVETADPTSAAHRVADEHKRKLTAYVAGLLADAGYRDHKVLAGQLVLLMDGALVTALREQSASAAERAKSTAAALLASAQRAAAGPTTS